MSKTTNNQQFIKINNHFFYNSNGETSLWISKIGTLGFALYCYFLVEQGEKKSILTDINQILLETKFSTRTTLSDYIYTLQKNKLLTLERLYIKPNLKPRKDKLGNDEPPRIQLHEKIRISCNEKSYKLDNNFTMISCDLFKNKIKIIGHVGWSILCLLSKLFNPSYSTSPNDPGCCNPSYEHMSTILDVNRKTLGDYIKILDNNSLIKIYEQKSKPYEDANGKSKIRSYNNQYIVYNRIPGHEYYIDIKKNNSE
jgi:hypothetical protein